MLSIHKHVSHTANEIHQYTAVLHKLINKHVITCNNQIPSFNPDVRQLYVLTFFSQHLNINVSTVRTFLDLLVHSIFLYQINYHTQLP